MTQEFDYSAELKKIEAYMDEHNLSEIEINGVNVSIHQETICNGYERTIDRTGYITMVTLEYGDVNFWDFDERETIQPDEITYGCKEIIESFWAKIDIYEDQI